jgi:hypothetical protein
MRFKFGLIFNILKSNVDEVFSGNPRRLLSLPENNPYF